MKRIIVALVLILSCCAALPAGAYVYENPAPLGSASSFSLGEGLSLAKEFSLSQAFAIESIAVYFSAADAGAQYYFKLYNEDLNGYLLSGLFKTYNFISDGSGSGWYGVSNLSNLVLGPGSYWIEVGATSGTGELPSDGTGTTTGAVVTTDTSTGVSTDSSDTLDLGLQLTGEEAPTPTPEPSTLALAVAGLAGVITLRLRRNA